MADGIEEYRGARTTVRFEGARCIHARHCVLERPEMFRPNVEGPWIDPDAVAAEIAEAQIMRCPSGALSFVPEPGHAAEPAPGVNTVRLWQNGPLAFQAALEIAGKPSGVRATLCRCGKSANKPFCDHRHVEAGFEASGEPAGQDTPVLAARGGPLKVTPTADGPLMVEGALEICSASGRTLARTTKTFLCRCGASANKPYCDGSHKGIGFAAA
jgi:CDGSH-type Zn-finger protein/uncharacterized Fe-S cluster protein YjdI